MSKPPIGTFQVHSLQVGISPISRINRVLRQCIYAGMSVVFCLAIVYLVSLNQLSTSGFKLQQVRAEQYELRQDLEELEILISNESTLYAYRTNREVQSMPLASGEFIVRNPNTSLALAR